MADISTDILGMKMKNPVMPAAGPPCLDGDAMVAVAEGGAGAIVAKTVSRQPAKVPRPCMYRIRNSMLNTELWSDLPVEQWIKTEYKKALATGLPLIASLGYNAEDIGELAPKLEKAGVHALELSTHYLGTDPKPMVDAIKAAKEGTSIPVLPKLSPNILDIMEFARAAVKAGADGIVAINSLGPCLTIDLETGMPVLGGDSGYGWVSGDAIKPVALRCVYDIARAVDVPVIGVGGIRTGRDAAEFIMAGAAGVGVCTAAILEGPSVFGRIARELEVFMAAHDYRTIDDLRGVAIRNAKGRKGKTSPSYPKVDADLCTGCDACVKHCIYDALSLKEDIARVDTKKCYGCGLCTSYCAVRAITIKYW